MTYSDKMRGHGHTERGARNISCVGIRGLRIILVLLVLATGGAFFSTATGLAIKLLETFGPAATEATFTAKLVLSGSYAILAVVIAMSAGRATSGVFGGGIPEIRALYSGGLRPIKGLDEAHVRMTTEDDADEAFAHGCEETLEGDGDEGFASLSHPFLSSRALVCKLASLAFAIGAGLPIGREGPLIHSTCCFAAGLLRSKAFISIGMWRELRAQVLLAAVAVGVGVTFGTPIAGALFAVEVISVTFLSSGWYKLFLAGVWACVMRHIVGHLGQAMYIRLPMNTVTRQVLAPVVTREALYSVSGLQEFAEWSAHLDVLFIAASVGALGGLAGSAFTHLNVLARRVLWHAPARSSHSGRVLSRLAIAAAIAMLVVAWPSMIGNFLLAISGSRGRLDGEHELLRDALQCSSDCAFRRLLSTSSLSRNGDEDLGRLLRIGVYVVLGTRELLLAPIALTLPLTGGCVKPLLVLGCFVGAISKGLLMTAFTKTTWPTVFNLPLSVFALFGAGATCASVTALASAVTLLEMTNSLTSISFPVFVAALTGRAVAHHLVHPGGTFFDVQAARKSYRALPRNAYDILACSKVEDACPGHVCMPVWSVVSSAVTLRQLENTLHAVPPHLTFLPVVENYGHPAKDRFIGAISRDAAHLFLRRHLEVSHADTVVSLDDTDLIVDASAFTVVNTIPCSDLIPYLQRSDFAFVITASRILVGVITRESFITLAQESVCCDN